jgi:hypothetical protein
MVHSRKGYFGEQMILIKFVEIKQQRSATNTDEKEYVLSEITVNPQYLVSAREESLLKQKFLELKESFPKNLDKRQEFTRLSLHKGQSGFDVVVIGSLESTITKINQTDQFLAEG